MRSLAPLAADQRAAVIAAARSFVDVPYRHRGRTRVGIDCVGLAVAALAEAGIEVADRRFYSPQPDGVTLRAALVERLGEPFWRKGDAVELLQPGDLLLMAWNRHPSHVALTTPYPLGGLAVIHSYAEAGRVVEHRLDSKWTARVREAWRL